MTVRVHVDLDDPMSSSVVLTGVVDDLPAITTDLGPRSPKRALRSVSILPPTCCGLGFADAGRMALDALGAVEAVMRSTSCVSMPPESGCRTADICAKPLAGTRGKGCHSDIARCR